tara:strand:+ start:19 stop:339 length:321 start_codon:yes stop_codon:yes gene_type:complete
MKDIKYKHLEVDKKHLLVVYFDFEYPIEEQNISNLTQAISNIVNKDDRFLNRVIFLPKGFDMYNLKEDDFIDIWKSKVNPEKVDEIINEEKDSNQLELFNEKEIIG